MITRLMLLFTGLAMASSAAFAQAPADDIAYVTRAELKSELGKISQQIAALGQQMNGSKPVAAPSSLADLEKRLAAVEKAQDKIIRLGNSQALVIDQIAARDDRGDYYPVLNGNSEQSIASISRAFEKTIPKHGLFVVHNRTNGDKWITINRDQYLIPAGNPREFEFAPGNVTTRVPGESEKNWYLGPSTNYRHDIDINDLPAVRYIYNPAPVFVESGGWVAAY